MASTAMAADLPQTQMVVAGNLGITTQSQELETPFWTEEIPRESDGAFEIQFSPWNEMGLDGSDVIQLVRKGLIQVGTTQMGYYAGTAPIVDGTDLAGLSPDIETFHAVTDAFRPVLEQHYAEQGLKALGFWSFQAQVLFCNEKLDSLADLRGRRVRTSGVSQSDFVEHFGGSGVSIAWGEVQQALQTGVLDCAITGSVGGYSGKWYEAADYLHPLPINWGSSVMVINRDFWESLSPQAQEFLHSNVNQLSDRIWKQNKQQNKFGVACLTTGPCPLGEPAGMHLVPVTEQELQLRKEALKQTVLPRYAERCGSACAKKWNATVGEVVDLKMPVD